jgi:hypothetical protein
MQGGTLMSHALPLTRQASILRLKGLDHGEKDGSCIRSCTKVMDNLQNDTCDVLMKNIEEERARGS